jgi:hypothetical protein
MCLAAILAMTSASHAGMISGSINFSSSADGGVIFQDSDGNTTTNLSTAKGIQSWVFPEVEVGSGSFDVVPDGTSVLFSEQWAFNPTTSKTPLWTIAGPGNFAFHLSSADIAFQNDFFLAIRATGTLTGTNHDPTPATWLFTTQGVATQGKFSWSSSVVAKPVPDGGTTVALLGGSLLGLFGLRRWLSAH